MFALSMSQGSDIATEEEEKRTNWWCSQVRKTNNIECSGQRPDSTPVTAEWYWKIEVQENNWNQEQRREKEEDRYSYLFIKHKKRCGLRSNPEAVSSQFMTLASVSTEASICFPRPAIPNKVTFDQVLLITDFFPPPFRLPSWRKDCGLCVASGCLSHTPSVTMRG